jgi:hypothetical protein
MLTYGDAAGGASTPVSSSNGCRTPVSSKDNAYGFLRCYIKHSQTVGMFELMSDTCRMACFER